MPEPVDFAPGAALIHDRTAWVFLDERPGHRLGAAVAWWLRSGADRLSVIAERETGIVARRAGAFRVPIEVWTAKDRDLVRAEPEVITTPAQVADHHLEFQGMIAEAGADPVIEHGVVVGEVRGLEVCRVVDDPVTGVTRLDVGVGAHDREAFQMIHGDVPTVESLARVVTTVAEHRQVGAPPHPLNQIAAERLIRWRLIESPELIAAERVVATEPPVVRPNLRDATPCVAIAEPGGVVVCTAGVDLEVVPYAADARLGLPDVGDGLMIVMSPRDHVGVIDEMNELLIEPARVIEVD